MFISVACSLGTYYKEGRCEKCPQGTYQDEEGQNSCKQCPTDSENMRGAKSVWECKGI